MVEFIFNMSRFIKVSPWEHHQHHSLLTIHEHFPCSFIRDSLTDYIYVKTLHKDLSRNFTILNLFGNDLQGIFKKSLKNLKDLQQTFSWSNTKDLIMIQMLQCLSPKVELYHPVP